MLKTIPDCRILHTGNPKAFHRFAAPGILIHQPEDQLTLASGICGAHNRIHPFVLHQPAEKVKLLFLILRYFILPFLRQNRQISIAPFGILFSVGFRLRQLQKMADTPAYQIPVAFHVAVLFLSCAQHRRQRHSDRGLFRNYQLHSRYLHFYKLGSFLPTCFSLDFTMPFSRICSRCSESRSMTPFSPRFARLPSREFSFTRFSRCTFRSKQVR